MHGVLALLPPRQEQSSGSSQTSACKRRQDYVATLGSESAVAGRHSARSGHACKVEERSWCRCRNMLPLFAKTYCAAEDSLSLDVAVTRNRGA